MPRDHAQIRLSIWSDDDFRALPGNAQHLYMVLLTHPELSYCGVMDWRPAKLSGLVGDWTADDVRAAAAVLVDRLYLVVDETTEEVLVRSFVRRDGLMKQPKMATAMATAHSAVGSSVLRGVVVGELQRLHEEEPGLNGWGSEKASELLARPSVDPSVYPCGKGTGNPSVNPFPGPSGKGSGKASVSPSSLLLAPSSSTPSSPPNGGGRERGHRLPEDFTPTEELVTWAKDRGFNAAQIGEMTERFIDHFRSTPGSKGVKTDWARTWRNWVGKEDPRRVRGTVHRLPVTGARAAAETHRPDGQVPHWNR